MHCMGLLSSLRSRRAAPAAIAPPRGSGTARPPTPSPAPPRVIPGGDARSRQRRETGETPPRRSCWWGATQPPPLFPGPESGGALSSPRARGLVIAAGARSRRSLRGWKRPWGGKDGGGGVGERLKVAPGAGPGFQPARRDEFFKFYSTPPPHPLLFSSFSSSCSSSSSQRFLLRRLEATLPRRTRPPGGDGEGKGWGGGREGKTRGGDGTTTALFARRAACAGRAPPRPRSCTSGPAPTDAIGAAALPPLNPSLPPSLPLPVTRTRRCAHACTHTPPHPPGQTPPAGVRSAAPAFGVFFFFFFFLKFHVYFLPSFLFQFRVGISPLRCAGGGGGTACRCHPPAPPLHTHTHPPGGVGTARGGGGGGAALPRVEPRVPTPGEG
ncbi:cyclin-dependent kinase inhibitor 1B isoform 1-T5 [Alca torda]